jgi:hypothetical protein
MMIIASNTANNEITSATMPTQRGRENSAQTGKCDVSTTMIYTHVLNRSGVGVKSPLDLS